MIVAGSPLNIVATFVVPLDTDLTSIVSDWQLEGDDGVTYASGLSSTFTSSPVRRGTKLTFTDSLVVPNVLPLSVTTTYSIRWALLTDTGEFGYTQTIEVLPQQNHYLGAEDAVEVQGDTTIYATLPVSGAVVDIYQGNTLIYTASAVAGSPNSEGVEHSLNFNTTTLGILPSLTQYLLYWKFVDGRTQTMPGSLWVITPVMVSAIDQLRQFLNRLHQEARMPELDYDAVDLIRWLKMGQDFLNATGLYTTFDLTNAQGAIYHWWMTCSIVMALRNQYLVEGMRSFQFSGQQVTLDIDVTQYLSSIADQFQGQIDNGMLSFKQQLKNYGISGGDGSMNGKFQVGALGLSMSPASNLGYNGQGYRSWLRVR